MLSKIKRLLSLMRSWLRYHCENPRFTPCEIKYAATYSEKRKRVLHVIGNFITGGSSRLVADLAEHLGREYQMQVITKYLPFPVNYKGLDIKVCPESEGIETAIRAYDPDLIHVHYWPENWYGQAFRAIEKFQIPVIENINVPTAPYSSKAVKMFVYVSHYVKDRYSRNMEANVVIYPGTDFNFFHRRKIEIPLEHCIGMVYRLDNDKLNEDSIDPFIAVARKASDVRCLIIGNGVNYRRYKEKVRRANVIRNFEFTGAVSFDRLQHFYEQMSLFVAPVHAESFGHVVPIAMGVGVPVVGYRVGALEEILGGTQMLVSPGDCESLADLTVSLLKDRSRRIDISRINQKRATELFSLESMINSYRELYEKILK